MIKKVDHIGIVVRDVNEALKFFGDALGLQPILQETIPDQGIKVVVLPVGDVNIELLEPIVPDTGVAKYLESRGEGIHHIAVEVDDVQESIDDLVKKETRMIDLEPKIGAHNKRIAFIHPKAAHGVLLEVCKDGEHE
jgi:methylmalonyl-CoA/ethylmalonyl-CoA epimerase